MSQVKAGAAYVELLTRDAQLVKGLAAAQRRLQDFGASTRALGASLFAIGAAAATPIGLSVATFASFDDGMRAVRAVTQATAEDFAKLTAEAKRLGATTSYSASEVAGLMGELGRAGFNPDQVIAMTGAVMDLARATGTDATESAGYMAATIRQFGLEAGEAVRVADGLTAAANKSFNSVGMLGEALSYAGPVAADANMSLEETLAILGTLGNMGIQGSEAGTALRRLLVLTAAEAEKFTDTFGVATSDAAGNVRPLVDILGEVAAAANNLPTAERGKKFAEVFGMLGITSASAIGKTAANTKELLAEIQAATGVAASSAAEMESGLGGAFRILLSSLEGVQIAIGEALEGPLRKMTDAASGAFGGLIKWIEANHEALQAFAGVALGLIAAGAAIFAIGSAFAIAGAVISGFMAVAGMAGAIVSGIGTAFAVILSPIGLVTAAVVALGGYLLSSTGAGGLALDWLAERFGSLYASASEAIGAIGAALARGDIAAAGAVLWASLNLQWAKGTAALTEYWMAFKDVMLSAADSMIFGIAGAISSGWAAIESGWVETIGFLADAWGMFAGGLAKTWYTVVGFIRKAWVGLKSAFDEDIDVKAEVQKIDDDTAGKIAATSGETNSAILRREAQRKARQAEIDAGRQGRGVTLEDMQAERAAAREAAGAKSIDEAAAGLASAQNDLTAALQTATTDPATPDDETEPATDPNAKPAAAEVKRAAMVDEITRRAESASDTASTFQGAAVRGLGADSLSDRQLSLLTQIAGGIKKIAENTEEGIAYQ